MVCERVHVHIPSGNYQTIDRRINSLFDPCTSSTETWSKRKLFNPRADAAKDERTTVRVCVVILYITSDFHFDLSATLGPPAIRLTDYVMIGQYVHRTETCDAL